MLNNIVLGFLSLPGGSEWIIIGLIALLFFGRRLPEVAKGLGKSIFEFKKGLYEAKKEADDIKKTVEEPEDKKDED